MTPTAAVERPPAVKLARFARPLIATSVGVVGVALTFFPADGLMLEWLVLIPLASVAMWCALPIHRAAARSIAGGRLTVQGLASIGVVAVFAWSVQALLADRSTGHLAPIALATALVAVAQYGTRLAGGDGADEASPAWLPSLVLAVAALSLALWWIVDGAGAGASAGAAVLLGSAPAALMLADPAALAVSRRRGSEIGLQSAGADAMLTAGQIDTVVLDKNGTVTTGELSVMAVDPLDPDHLRNLRWFAGALAHSSEHPVARAIAKLAPRGRVSNVEGQPMVGLTGSVDRHPVRIAVPAGLGAESVEEQGTQVAVEVDGRALGWITVGDTVRTDARQGVERLSGLGLDPILVSERSVIDTTQLAGEAGIDTYYPRTTIDGCVALVDRLRTEGRVVAMVSESATLTPALDVADLAISGAGQTPEGGIALADIDVRAVGDAIVLMRSTMSTMLMNRRWAVLGMLVPIPFTAAGLVEPLYASLLSLICALGVVVNSSKISQR